MLSPKVKQYLKKNHLAAIAILITLIIGIWDKIDIIFIRSEQKEEKLVVNASELLAEDTDSKNSYICYGSNTDSLVLIIPVRLTNISKINCNIVSVINHLSTDENLVLNDLILDFNKKSNKQLFPKCQVYFVQNNPIVFAEKNFVTKLKFTHSYSDNNNFEKIGKCYLHSLIVYKNNFDVYSSLYLIHEYKPQFFEIGKSYGYVDEMKKGKEKDRNGFNYKENEIVKENILKIKENQNLFGIYFKLIIDETEYK